MRFLNFFSDASARYTQTPQIEAYESDPAGKLWKSMGLGSSIPDRKIFGFFWCFTAKFVFFLVENGWKLLEKSKDFRARTTAFDSH